MEKEKESKDFLFFSKAQPFPEGNRYGFCADAARELSNFAVCDKMILVRSTYLRKPVKVPTVEHAYQLHKYLCSSATPKLREEIIARFIDPETTAHQAKKLGTRKMFQHYNVNLDDDLWKRKCRAIMKELVSQKIRSSRKIQDILRTIDRNGLRLVHLSRYDEFWGATVLDPVEGESVGQLKGRNELGNIYQELIEEFSLH